MTSPKSSMKAMNVEVNNVFAVKESNFRRGRDQTPVRRCYRCGSTDHWSNCTEKNLYCEFCKVRSHNTKICQRKLAADAGDGNENG